MHYALYSTPEYLISTADDFGLSEGVNEAVERAHREGVLTSASLMVAAPAAADAVRRAKANPGLGVGLHLVLVEGPAVLPPAEIPALVRADGWFPPNQARLGVRYGFSAAARRQIAREIRAQFAAFAATGLPLDHVDAHKHMHLHPIVAGLVIGIGAAFGMKALRVPRGEGRALEGFWAARLARRARRAGLAIADRVYGIADSGRLDEACLLRLLGTLGEGLSEIYFHPATSRNALLARLMPGYRHEAEFAALISPRVREALAARALHPTTYAAAGQGL
ncbi:MAG: hopanoid biosynthesis-associated protein HpnK [Acetobacteraceae bacterium]